MSRNLPKAIQEAAVRHDFRCWVRVRADTLHLGWWGNYSWLVPHFLASDFPRIFMGTREALKEELHSRSAPLPEDYEGPPLPFEEWNELLVDHYYICRSDPEQ